MKSPAKRKLLKIAGSCFVLLALLAAALPVWFPWLLRPALKHYGIRFGTYQRLGYTRFVLKQVRGDFYGARFESEQVEAFLPTKWLWCRYVAGTDRNRFVRTSSWRLRIEPRTDGKPASPPTAAQSTFTAAETINAILPTLRSWLPAAHLVDGIVEIRSNSVAIPTLDWNQGRLAATISTAKPQESFALTADFSAGPPYTVFLDAKRAEVTLKNRLSRKGDLWEMQSEIFWQSNRVEFSAGFDRTGWWPRQARLASDSVRVPAGLVRLEGYDDLTGAFRLNWEAGQFNLDASATATPKASNDSPLPPVEIRLSASGDPQSVVLETLRVSSPAAQADLSQRVGLDRSGRMITDAAALKVTLDFAKIPGASLNGKLDGEVRIQPASANSTRAEFELSGSNLAGWGLVSEKATITGHLQWPLLTVDRIAIECADGSTFNGEGQLDLKSRQMANGRWQLQGPLVGPFLPDGFRYSSLQATGQISGSVGAPVHSGTLVLGGAAAPHLKPCEARIAWRGERFNVSEANVQVTAGDSKLLFDGAVQIGETPDRPTRIEMAALTLTRGDVALYQLENRCRLEFVRNAATNTSATWSIRVDALHLSGPDREVALGGHIEWPRRGHLEASCRGFRLSELRDFVDLPAAEFWLAAMKLEANWQGGPVHLSLSAEGECGGFEARPVSAKMGIRADATGLMFDPLIISESGGPIVVAHGTLPLTLVPGRPAGLLEIQEEKPFDFRAATEPNKAFWDFVGNRLGIGITEPRAQLDLRGTLSNVEGDLQLRADLIERRAGTNEWMLPRMERLEMEARLETKRVRLNAFKFEVEGQPVRISGDLPLQGHILADFVTGGRLPDWREATGRVEIVDARIEPLARFLPKVLSPQGNLTVNLAVLPGGKLEGELRIGNAATRPFAPLAPIREIEASIKFSERRATIETMGGRIGGQAVSLTGHFHFPTQGEPEFDLALHGDSLPLVYRPGLLLRGDVDLRLVQTRNQPTLVSGEIDLRDGLYLQDIRSLMVGEQTHPRRRPPFFSVEEKPFADWKLDLRLKGDRFLRMRSPYFRGEVSADFRIKGDLEEPMALGEARIHSGRVQFPFGTLSVDQGYVTLTSEDPYEPELFAAASARNYGYNIKMEVTGTASVPRVNFSSTPPLTSEQILLMLATGELPRDELAFSNQKKAGNLALYLGKDLFTRLLGNEDSNERLTIRSGEHVSEAGQSTYYIEYKLTDDWSVVGEYDRFNALNAGLKWRIFSR
ncbi:MAG TPA: translocation/assembly module TamB domain-containing protein [Verrucomicrobiae bacterium]|nr:translocation/assembly module TamB domain-containing protein [Verrucomicrobiae bacterium]